mgnify:CR=1 FL=1
MSTLILNIIWEVLEKMKIGDRIRALREERGIRQTDLAEAIGVALTTISGYELGTRTPRIDVLTKIAEYFGVTPNYLLANTLHLSI